MYALFVQKIMYRRPKKSQSCLTRPRATCNIAGCSRSPKQLSMIRDTKRRVKAIWPLVGIIMQEPTTSIEGFALSYQQTFCVSKPSVVKWFNSSLENWGPSNCQNSLTLYLLSLMKQQDSFQSRLLSAFFSVPILTVWKMTVKKRMICFIWRRNRGVLECLGNLKIVYIYIFKIMNILKDRRKQCATINGRNSEENPIKAFF